MDEDRLWGSALGSERRECSGGGKKFVEVVEVESKVKKKKQLVRLSAVFTGLTALLELKQVALCSHANVKCELKPGKAKVLVGNESHEMDGNSARRARRFTVYTVVIDGCRSFNSVSAG